MTDLHVETLGPGFPTWTIRIYTDDSAWTQTNGKPGLVKIALYEVDACENDGTPLYWREGSRSNADPTGDLAQAEVTVSAWQKWDGCCEISEQRLHFCGSDSVAAFAAALQRGYELAEEAMA